MYCCWHLRPLCDARYFARIVPTLPLSRPLPPAETSARPPAMPWEPTFLRAGHRTDASFLRINSITIDPETLQANLENEADASQ